MKESKIRLIFYVFGILAAVFLSVHLFMLFANTMSFVTRTSSSTISLELKNIYYKISLVLLLFFAYSHGTLGLRRTLYNFYKKKIGKAVIILLWLTLVPLVYFALLS